MPEGHGGSASWYSRFGYQYGNFYLFAFGFCFLRQGFSVALEPVLELALIDHAGPEITEIRVILLPRVGIEGVHHHHPSLWQFLRKLGNRLERWLRV